MDVKTDEKNKIKDRILLIVKPGAVSQFLKVRYVRAWGSHHFKQRAYI